MSVICLIQWHSLGSMRSATGEIWSKGRGTRRSAIRDSCARFRRLPRRRDAAGRHPGFGQIRTCQSVVAMKKLSGTSRLHQRAVASRSHRNIQFAQGQNPERISRRDVQSRIAVRRRDLDKVKVSRGVVDRRDVVDPSDHSRITGSGRGSSRSPQGVRPPAVRRRRAVLPGAMPNTNSALPCPCCSTGGGIPPGCRSHRVG